MYIILGVVAAVVVLVALLYLAFRSGQREFEKIKANGEFYQMMDDIRAGRTPRRRALSQSESKVLRRDAAKRKKAGQSVQGVCGKCGGPFLGWKPVRVQSADGSWTKGFQGRGAYQHNFQSTKKTNGMHVDDSNGPVGVCGSCWLTFCGECAEGRDFFAEGTFVLDVPIYSCPFCHSDLTIEPEYFGGEMREIT